MNKPHKWAKEIKAWADGFEIEWRTNNGSMHTEWREAGEVPNWHVVIAEFRIKQQPKEPKYLYVFRTSTNGQVEYRLHHDKDTGGAYIGKIKLENEE
jgi:hypothetical protein